MWLPAHLLYFVCGMALAVLQVVGLRVRPIIAGPLAVLSYLVVSTPIAGNVNGAPVTLSQTFVKVALYAVFACAVVAPLVLDGGNGYARLLSAAPIVWLGEISYEVFLLHVIVMEIASASVLQWPVFTGSMPVLFAVTLVMTVPLAWLLHRWTWARLLPRAGSVENHPTRSTHLQTIRPSGRRKSAPGARLHTVCNVKLTNVHPSKSPDMNIPSITAELRRRRFLAGTLTGALGGLGAMVLSSCSTQTARADHAHPTASAAPPSPAAASPSPAAGATVEPLAANADQALQLLRDGNQRFAADHAEHLDDTLARRMAVSSTQKPFGDQTRA